MSDLPKAAPSPRSATVRSVALLGAIMVVLAALPTAPASPASHAQPIVPPTVAASLPRQAQAPKRPLSWDDFDTWRSITSPTLSPDGRWLAYSYMPLRGDGEVIARQLRLSPDEASKRPINYHISAGELPQPPFPQGPTPSGRPPPPRTVEHLFTGDSQFLLSLVFPSADAQREARRLSSPRPTDPLRGQATDTRNIKQSLALVDLAAGRSELVRDVQSVQVSLRDAWVAYLHEPEKPFPTALAASPTQPPFTARPHRLAAQPAPENRRLVLRELRTGPPRGWGAAKQLSGSAKTFDYVSEYALSQDARTLLYLVDSPSRSRSGLYAYTPGSTASPQAIFRTAKADAERLTTLTWDPQQTRAAFLIKRKSGHYEVGLWTRGEPTARVALTAHTPGLPRTMRVGEHTTLGFSSDGKKLYVGLVPHEPTLTPAPTDSRTPPEPIDPLELTYPELWRWDDAQLPPRRNVLAELDHTRSFPGVLDLQTGRYTQIGSPALREVQFSAEGHWALAFDEAPYLRLRDHDATFADVYAVNTTTGTHRLLSQKLRGASGDEGLPTLYFSPTPLHSIPASSHALGSPSGPARYVAYFDKGHWWAANVASGQAQNLTAALPVSFADEQHDKPEPPPPYGWAGWLADGRSLIVYDRYDLWKIFVDGQRPAINLTRGMGRATRIILRVQDTEPHNADEPAPPPLWVRGIALDSPLTLRGEDERTRDSGFFRLSAHTLSAEAPPDSAPHTDSLERLLWGEENYRFLATARHDSRSPAVSLFTASRFDKFPDLWISAADFSTPQRVSDGATQLAPFIWGTPPERIDYATAAGTPLSGLLYTPSHLDPAQKYPLLVYLYERLSPARHAFFAPSYSANINLPYAISHGYLVYLVDIAYEIGSPGPSALDSVNAALDALLSRHDFIAPDRIGLQGSSWGGYQVAYLVTHSDRFRAAVAGSPVGNMTSAYADLRWRSGRSRLFQYEQSQSRIGPPLTEAPERYLANSPVLAAHRLNTPLLILHNDGDGVVPWHQSTQLFLTLRRHQRPVWFLNYPYESHEIVRYANRRDFQQRMWAFFEHYLRSAPAPEWLAAPSHTPLNLRNKQ